MKRTSRSRFSRPSGRDCQGEVSPPSQAETVQLENERKCPDKRRRGRRDQKGASRDFVSGTESAFDISEMGDFGITLDSRVSDSGDGGRLKSTYYSVRDVTRIEKLLGIARNLLPFPFVRKF